jgi:hypothetical protein
MCEGDKKYIQKSVEDMDGRDYLGDLLIDGRTVLKFMLKDGLRLFTGLVRLTSRMVASCEYSSDPSGCVSGGKFLGWPSSC